MVASSARSLREKAEANVEAERVSDWLSYEAHSLSLDLSLLGITYSGFSGIVVSPQLRGPLLWGLQKKSKEHMKLQRKIVKALRGTIF